LNEFQNVSRTTVVDLQNVNLLTPPRSTDTGGVLEYGAHRPFSIQLIRPLAYLAVQITVLTSVPFSLNEMPVRSTTSSQITEVGSWLFCLILFQVD